MKKCILFLFCFISSWSMLAQNPLVYSYEYDHAGNRIKRATIVLTSKSALISEKDTETSDHDFFVDLIGEVDIQVFPNPASHKITINIKNSPEFSHGEFFLYNMQGQLLNRGTMNDVQTDISLSEYSKGTYIVKVSINDFKKEWKIIKQ